MKLISLIGKHGEGKFAMVDDEDYYFLIKFRWYARKSTKTFYAMTRNKNAMHRLILNVTTPEIFIDHKDHNGLNNQRNNIRVATRSQNAANITKKKSSSKYLGVNWNASEELWYAAITPNGKRIHLGTFEQEVEAAEAYNIAAKEHFKEFANLNDIDIPDNFIRLGKRQKQKSTKYRGVDLYFGKYRARIQFKNKKITIGYFKTDIDAALAYNEASLKYCKFFANLNKV